MKIPILTKTYNCFDDGKIRESRRYEVKIIEIIPFDKIDNKTLLIWNDEVETVYWLFAEKTDFFIKATDGDNEEYVFVRTTDNGWFSMGFLTSGRLDVDGTLTSMLK